jgi:hypothetical protein
MPYESCRCLCAFSCATLHQVTTVLPHKPGDQCHLVQEANRQYQAGAGAWLTCENVHRCVDAQPVGCSAYSRCWPSFWATSFAKPLLLLAEGVKQVASDRP